MGSRGGRSSLPIVQSLAEHPDDDKKARDRNRRDSTYSEVAAVKGTVRVDHHHGKMPAKEVLVIDLWVPCGQLGIMRVKDSLLLTSTRTHFSFCTCFRSPMIRCFAAAGDALSGDMFACIRCLVRLVRQMRRTVGQVRGGKQFAGDVEKSQIRRDLRRLK